MVGLGITIPVMWDYGYFGPIPYSFVELMEERAIPEGILLTYNFDKNSCVYQDLQVFGEYLGVWSKVDYQFFDTDPVEATPTPDEAVSEDRLKGQQTLHILILTEGVEYTKLEIRTRHLCDGDKVVDRVFASYTP